MIFSIISTSSDIRARIEYALVTSRWQTRLPSECGENGVLRFTLILFSARAKHMEEEPGSFRNSIRVCFNRSSLGSVFLQFLDEPEIFQYNNGKEDDKVA